MAICPKGHDSIADDFCDMCGRPISRQSTSQGMHQGGQSGAFGQSTPMQSGAQEYPYAGGRPELCPVCHTPRNGDARYCEACGYEYLPAPVPDPADLWAPPVPPGPPLDTDGWQASAGGTYPPPTSPPTGYAPPHPGQGYPEGPSDSGTHFGPGPVTPPPLAPPPSGYPQVSPGPTFDSGSGSVHTGHGLPPGPPFTETPPPPGQERYAWTVWVTADAEYFQRVVSQGGPDAHAMRFPPYHEPWHVSLRGQRMRVGRRRAGESGSGSPEIDLSGPPADPGISHLHVVLMNRQDGSWALVDPGSTNGTTLNGGHRAIDVNVPVDLHDGDRIHVGAWTTLEVRLHPV